MRQIIFFIFQRPSFTWLQRIADAGSYWILSATAWWWFYLFNYVCTIYLYLKLNWDNIQVTISLHFYHTSIIVPSHYGNFLFTQPCEFCILLTDTAKTNAIMKQSFLLRRACLLSCLAICSLLTFAQTIVKGRILSGDWLLWGREYGWQRPRRFRKNIYSPINIAGNI